MSHPEAQLNRPPQLPDAHWVAVAEFLNSMGVSHQLILAPNEFLHLFPGTIAIHVRRDMMPDARIDWFVVHKGMLHRVDAAMLREAVACTAVFANEVFVVFARDATGHADENHVAPIIAFTQRLANPPSAYRVGIIVSAYNRPWALKRTLRSLRRLNAPMLVVDDHSSLVSRWRNRIIALTAGADYLQLPRNLGLAHAVNAGMAHFLARLDINWISVFDSDCETSPDTLDVFARITPHFQADRTLFTGYRSPCHHEHEAREVAGHHVLIARSCSGQHLHAHRDYWMTVLPIPTAYSRAPQPTGGVYIGQGSDQDWWVSCWCPRSGVKRGGDVVIVPGLVTTFGAGHSTWGSSGL